jgi:hypothetical protein
MRKRLRFTMVASDVVSGVEQRWSQEMFWPPEEVWINRRIWISAAPVLAAKVFHFF